VSVGGAATGRRARPASAVERLHALLVVTFASCGARGQLSSISTLPGPESVVTFASCGARVQGGGNLLHS
jgi:hypothetical protein